MNRPLAAVALVLVAVLVGAALGRVATAANTVPAGHLGQGSTATSAYTITNVDYTLNASNPRDVSQVSFTISPATPRVVKARLFNTGSWYTCTNAAGTVTCLTTTPALATTSAVNLTVIATQ